MLVKSGSKTVVCMTTYNRIDCARINQEIIKLNYDFRYPIVHACSSDDYEKYLEDIFVRCEQPRSLEAKNSTIVSLQHGALNLLKQSITAAHLGMSPKYIVHLEGDTWIMDEKVIAGIISKMDSRPELLICTSAWDEDQIAFKYLANPIFINRVWTWYAAVLRKLGRPLGVTCRDSLATQFFVIRAIPEVLSCFQSLVPMPGLDLEQALYRTFMSRFQERNILRQRIREPVHPYNRYVCEHLSLYSQHWPARGTAHDSRDPGHPRYISSYADGKRETLMKFPTVRRGENIDRLLNAKSLDYYNVGASRT